MSLDDELKRAIAEVAEDAARPLHLSQRELLDFLRGELEEFETQRVRSHLLACRTCLEEYRAVKSFLHSEEKIDQKALHSSWVEFQQRQSGQSFQPRTPGILARIRGSAALKIPALAAALAVAFAAGMVGMYLWTHSNEVKLNHPIADLTAFDSMIRSDPSQEQETLYSHDNDLTLILVNPLTFEMANIEEFDVEIVNQDGETVFAGTGLQKTEKENFSIRLPAGYLDPGRYRILLRAPANPEVLAEYHFALR